MDFNERFENMLQNLDEYYTSKIDLNTLIIDDLPEIDLLNISEHNLSDRLMKTLITIDLFIQLKEFSHKQLALYEKVLTDVYHIIEMIELNVENQKQILDFQKEILIRRRKIKELNNVLDLVPKRPGDTPERLNKLSVVGDRKEHLQYSLRSKNVFGGISENAAKLGIYKGKFIEAQRIRIAKTNEFSIRKRYNHIIESILEDNESNYNKQNVRNKILNFISKNKI